MAASKSIRRTRLSSLSGSSRPRFHPGPGGDLREILNRFSDALAVVAVAHRALDSLEIAADEGHVLRHGIAALRTVYND